MLWDPTEPIKVSGTRTLCIVQSPSNKIGHILASKFYHSHFEGSTTTSKLSVLIDFLSNAFVSTGPALVNTTFAHITAGSDSIQALKVRHLPRDAYRVLGNVCWIGSGTY